MNILNIGIDPGSSACKAATIVNGELITHYVDSILSVPSERSLLGSGQEMLHKLSGRKTKPNTPDLLYHLGVSNFVGSGAEKFDGLTSVISQSRFYDGNLLLKLILATISKFNPEKGQKINLELSLPVSVIKKEGNEALTEGIGSWLMGLHRFELNNTSYEIEIVSFSFFEQPIHAFLGLCLDNKLEWNNRINEGVPVFIIDVGGYTVDTCYVDNFDINYDYTKGRNNGFYVASDKLALAINDKFNVTISTQQAAKLLIDYSQNKSVDILVGTLSKSINDLAKQQFDFMTTNIIDFCRQVIPDSKKDTSAIVLIGGATDLLSPYLKNEYHTLITEPSRFLSAIGAYYNILLNQTE